MRELHLTSSERQQEALTSAHLSSAIDALLSDGLVILHGAVKVDHVDTVGRAFLLDIERQMRDRNGKLRTSIQPPRGMEFLFDDILMNPYVEQILSQLLGRQIRVGTYSSNVNGPGSKDQYLHVDRPPRKPEDPVGYRVDCVVVNIPVVDFTKENGATEIWPGTQFLPPEIGHADVSAELEAARRAEVPPVNFVAPRGSLLIRDIRLWHRGKANRTNRYRPMLSQIMTGGFDPTKDALESIPCAGTFPEKARPFFERGRLRYNVKYDCHAQEAVGTKGH